MKKKIFLGGLIAVIIIGINGYARAEKYEEKKAVIEKEAKQIEEKCWENVSIKNPKTTADMRKASYEVVNCLERIIKDKTKEVLKEKNAQTKAISSIDAMHKATSDFYFTLYNENKNCCSDKDDNICHCGTMAQVEYYFPWIEILNKTLVDVMMIASPPK